MDNPLPRTATVKGRMYVVEAQQKLATHLSGASDVLADGTIVLRTSHQQRWFYIQGIKPNGKLIRRRYRHDQTVTVEAWRPAPQDQE